jgi:hypothetical protein
MIILKDYIKELKIIEKNLNASKDASNSYAWLCVLESKLHSLDHFLENNKILYSKAMIAEKKKEL